jgi:hypothetical protein
MRDTYAPLTGEAVCPHCGQHVDGAPTRWNDLILVTLHWLCPRCRRPWKESRDARETARYWDPVSLGCASDASRSASSVT